MLERDSVNMELRFDLEARTAETERLRRRAKELQAALRRQGVGSADGGLAKDAATSRPAGGRFKRERFVVLLGIHKDSLALEGCVMVCAFVCACKPLPSPPSPSAQGFTSHTNNGSV